MGGKGEPEKRGDILGLILKRLEGQEADKLGRWEALVRQLPG